MADFYTARFSAVYEADPPAAVTPRPPAYTHGTEEWTDLWTPEEQQAAAAAAVPPRRDKAVELCREGCHLLLNAAEPEREWEHQTAQFNLVGRDWAADAPCGSARLKLRFTVLHHADCVGALQVRLRRVETALNLHRSGTMTLQEAYHAGAPMLVTRWCALVERAAARLLPADAAPAAPGAWGSLDIEMTLTNPTEC